jgi:hypothetical protein
MKIDSQAGAPPPAATTPPAEIAGVAPPQVTTALDARLGDRADFYASGNNKSTIFLNGREIMSSVNRDGFSKARVNLKEGDVIAVLQTGRFSDNFLWISAISAKGEFLFETSEAWKCYLPKNAAKWWDIKNIKSEEAVTFIPETSEYRHLVKRASIATPLYHGTPPIHCGLKEEGQERPPLYFYHVITKEDLQPKRVPPELVLTDPGLPWIGKNIRITLHKDRGKGIVFAGEEPTVAPINSAAPGSAEFKVVRGPRPGTILFEAPGKRGHYLWNDNTKVGLSDKVNGTVEFCLEKPVTGSQGFSIAWAVRPRIYLVATEAGSLALSDKSRDEDAVFHLEEVKGK